MSDPDNQTAKQGPPTKPAAPAKANSITLADPNLLRIFLSYKEIDARYAKEIKKRLQLIAPKRVDVFVAADPDSVEVGTPWRAGIAEALRKADVLILLYSDPKQDWGWCLYESGFFDGMKKSLADNRTDLVVLHGPDVKRPGPLEVWQAIEINPTREAAAQQALEPEYEGPAADQRFGVYVLLERLFEDTGIAPGVQNDGVVLGAARDVLCAPFSTPPVPESLPERLIPSIKILVSVASRASLEASEPVIPDDAEVLEMTRGTFEMLFDVRPHTDGTATPWGELMENWRSTSAGHPSQIVDSQLLWAQKLALTMQRAVKSKAIWSGLPLFRSAERSREGSRSYRPAIAIYRQTPVAFHFTLAFVDLPDELEVGTSVATQPGTDPNILTLSHLLAVCRMFRWAVIIKYQERLRTESDAQGVFNDLRVAISNLYVDSASRGLNPQSVLAAFADTPSDHVHGLGRWKQFVQPMHKDGHPATERRVIAELLKQWEAGTTPLAEKKADRTEALKLLATMRRLNRAFYELCARRLHELVSEMPE